jgi:hypothetical protein
MEKTSNYPERWEPGSRVLVVRSRDAVQSPLTLPLYTGGKLLYAGYKFVRVLLDFMKNPITAERDSFDLEKNRCGVFTPEERRKQAEEMEYAFRDYRRTGSHYAEVVSGWNSLSGDYRAGKLVLITPDVRSEEYEFRNEGKPKSCTCEYATPPQYVDENRAKRNGIRTWGTTCSVPLGNFRILTEEEFRAILGKPLETAPEEDEEGEV